MALTVTGRTGLGANYRGGYQYRRRPRRGMGQCSYDPTTGDTTCDSTVSDNGGFLQTDTGGSTASNPYLTPPIVGTTAPSSALSPASLQSDISTALTKGFQTLQLALLPSGGYLVQGPNGTYQIANNATAPAGSLFGSTSGSGLTMLVLLGGGLLLVMALEGGHR